MAQIVADRRQLAQEIAGKNMTEISKLTELRKLMQSMERTLGLEKLSPLPTVVAKADEKWGETPCAFIELRDGADTTEENVIQFCRNNMAGFKIPKTVIFQELPKTSTGKIQKFVLREQLQSLGFNRSAGRQKPVEIGACRKVQKLAHRARSSARASALSIHPALQAP